MANVRIKDLTNTAPSSASDDFFAIDGNTNGTRKLSAFNPTFGGQILAADGTAAAPSLSFASGSSTGFSRNGSNHIVVSQAANSVFTMYYSSGGVLGSAGGGYLQLAASGSITLAAAASNQSLLLSPTGTGAVVVSGASSLASGELGNFRLQDASNANRKLFFGIDNTVSPSGVGYIQAVLTGTTTLPLLIQPNGGPTLFGTAVNSNNGRLQLATHTASTGGIGFGTDASLYRYQAGGLALDATNNVPALIFRQSGTNAMYLYTSSLVGYIGTTNANGLIFQTGTTTALTLDSSQNATFAKDILLGTSGPIAQNAIAARASRQGLVFDGSSGATLTNYTFGTSDFTATFWVRHTNAPVAGVYEASIGAATGGLAINRTPSGVIEVSRSYVAAVLSGTTVLAAAKWYHVAVTRSGSSFVLYVNGVQDATATSSPDFNVANGYLGASPNLTTDRLTGILSQPLFYNRALSATEVKALYESGVPDSTDICAAGSQLLTGNNSTFATGQGTWQGINGGSVSAGSGVLTITTSGAYVGGGTENGLVKKGVRYRLVFTLASYTGTLNSVMPFVNNGVILGAGAYSAGTYTIDFTAAVTSYIGFSTANGNTGTFTIDNVTLVPFGAVLAPDAAQTGGGLTWYDTSGNAANITLPASGVAWNVPTSGNVTSGGQLNLRAGGTNGNVFISPTGTGAVRIAGTTTANLWSDSGLNLGIGTASGGSGLTFLSGSQNALFGTTTDSSNGRIQLATHTANTGGIGFGADVTLYRSAANVLRTDDSFEALNNSDTYLQVGAAAPYQRAAIGLTRRLNYGDVLFARNLQGQSGTDSYTTIGTDSGSGYAGFEAQYGGVARILLGTGATTANAVVTPTVALSVSTTNATFIGSITTAAPVGGAGAWELGVYTATAPTATGYVTIEIGGVQYKLLAAT